MKTIQILRTLINILFYTLIAVFIIGFIFFILLFLFPETLPSPLNSFSELFNSMLFSSMFSWKMYLIPISTTINYILFIVAIYFLRKSVSSFIISDFYSEKATTNLKNAGNIFVFIGVLIFKIPVYSAIHFYL